MNQLTVSSSSHNQVIDISPEVNNIIQKQGIKQGVCVVSAQHTTCSITTADLDPGTDRDLLDAVNAMFPKGDYRHPHDPAHVGDHIMSSLIGPSVTLPIQQGKLKLGTWQRLVLIELSGPRERKVTVNILV